MGYSPFRVHIGKCCKVHVIPFVDVEEIRQLTSSISGEDAVGFQLAFRRSFLVYRVVFPYFVSFLDKLVHEASGISRLFRVIHWLALFENHFHVGCGNSDAVHYGVSRVAVGYLAGEAFFFMFALQNKNRTVT